MKEKLVKQLNAPTSQERLDALKQLMAIYEKGEIPKPEVTDFVNNHIHTIYSFSPYSPTYAAYTAWINGLQTAGIMDHDSLAGAKEFVEAGKIIGLEVTVGVELRCNIENTPFNGRHLNNPDQNSIVYLAAHGIPHQSIDKMHQWLEEYRGFREQRNRKMVDNINDLLTDVPLKLDYDNDVRPLSQAREGGSVTERHILFALAKKITKQVGKGENTLVFLEETFDITPDDSLYKKLADKETQFYDYYLLGLLKSSLVEQFYVDATDECPDISDFIEITKELGAISAYPYLGDVAESPTGDKKAQSFEDSFLDELMDWLPKAGFNAVTYMPSRNTTQQAARIANLAHKNQLFEISGEDINTPFQSFICLQLKKPEFQHLIPATWALIGHEKAATKNIEDGMFTDKTEKAYPDLQKRVEYFESIARK